MLLTYWMRLKRSENANRKLLFEVEEWKIGGGFYVRATLPVVRPSGSKVLRRNMRRDAGLETNRQRGCILVEINRTAIPQNGLRLDIGTMA